MPLKHMEKARLVQLDNTTYNDLMEGFPLSKKQKTNNANKTCIFVLEWFTHHAYICWCKTQHGNNLHCQQEFPECTGTLYWHITIYKLRQIRPSLILPKKKNYKSFTELWNKNQSFLITWSTLEIMSTLSETDWEMHSISYCISLTNQTNSLRNFLVLVFKYMEYNKLKVNCLVKN